MGNTGTINKQKQASFYHTYFLRPIPAMSLESGIPLK